MNGTSSAQSLRRTEASTASKADEVTVPVTVETFPRAESDLYFAAVVKKGGFGKFDHTRELAPIDDQSVIRLNRDTLYSAAVFDLDAGAVTITLPDAGARFISLQIIDEDQYTHRVVYEPGQHTLAREEIGTRYVITAVRILVDPSDPTDVERVHALQDAIRVEQSAPGTFEVPRWDGVSQAKVRDALILLADTLPDKNHMFGRREEVDPVRRLLGAASAWGGNPDRDAIYLNHLPSRGERRPRRRILVHQRLQREGLLRSECEKRVYAEQSHGEEGHGRHDQGAVRRLRRRGIQLSADLPRLELHGSPLSPARRDPRGHVEVPRGQAGDGQ
jgi:hypothetical protein